MITARKEATANCEDSVGSHGAMWGLHHFLEPFALASKVRGPL